MIYPIWTARLFGFAHCHLMVRQASNYIQGAVTLHQLFLPSASLGCALKTELSATSNNRSWHSDDMARSSTLCLLMMLWTAPATGIEVPNWGYC